MEIIRDPAAIGLLGRPVIALSDFDGVHLGQLALLRATVEWARTACGSPLACVFDPTSAQALAVGRAPSQITALNDRLELLATTGVIGVALAEPASSWNGLSLGEFMREYLVAKMRAFGVMIERNAELTSEQAGVGAVIAELGRECGLEVIAAPPVKVDGIEVSSARIRHLIAAGDLKTATKLLGRHHFLSGAVVHGHKRGRELGFPSANLACETQSVPPDGVYASRAFVDGAQFDSITNIGTRPTFGEFDRVIETHMLDFSRDVYGKRIRVALIERIRSQHRFDSVEALSRHITEDIKRVREVLARA
jgi:riboflavin kinase/FMN adenylyltransferase